MFVSLNTDIYCIYSSAFTQVELRKKEQLTVSQQVIAEQEEELAEVTNELVETEQENTQLRQSMEKILEETDYIRQVTNHTCNALYTLFSSLIFNCCFHIYSLFVAVRFSG